MLSCVGAKRRAVICSLDTATADALVLDRSFFRPLGLQHFYDPFALVSQICVRTDALTLFGLNDDELLPDLHITGAGVMRTGLGAHQEHLVIQDAQAADRKKVPAEVIQVASHEVDTDSDKAESIMATSGSEGSESASDSEQNDPPFRWPLTLNSMSACKPHILQWAETLKTGGSHWV